MSLLVGPHRVVLPILIPRGVALTRLIIGVDVHVTEMVTSVSRLTVHVNVYGDVLVVNTDVYPRLMVVRSGCLFG